MREKTIMICRHKIVIGADKTIMYDEKDNEMVSVTDWRKKIIDNYFSEFKREYKKYVDVDDVNWYIVAKIFMYFNAVNSADDYSQAVRFFNKVLYSETGDSIVFFWASHFLDNREKASKAFNILYS